MSPNQRDLIAFSAIINYSIVRTKVNNYCDKYKRIRQRNVSRGTNNFSCNDRNILKGIKITKNTCLGMETFSMTLPPSTSLDIRMNFLVAFA